MKISHCINNYNYTINLVNFVRIYNNTTPFTNAHVPSSLFLYPIGAFIMRTTGVYLHTAKYIRVIQVFLSYFIPTIYDAK